MGWSRWICIVAQRHQTARVLLSFSGPGRMWAADGRTPRGPSGTVLQTFEWEVVL